MAFNLNKLVQPECGAPNPLVAAAQQITMGPSSGSLRMHQQKQPTLNFTSEFLASKSNSMGDGQQQAASNFSFQNPVLSSTQQMPINLMNNPLNSGKLATDFLAEHELVDGMKKVRMMPGQFMSQFNIIQAQGNGGDQLEAKYRNDVSASHQQDQGDLPFWQNLSQQYIGPTTTTNSTIATTINSTTTTTTTNSAIASTTSSTIASTTSSAIASTINSTIASTTNSATTEEKTEKPVTKSETKKKARSTYDYLSPNIEYVFDERNPLKDQFDDPFAEGLKKLEQGDIPSAALLFEDAVQKKPEDAVAWRYLGTTQAQNEKDLSAIKALRHCLELDANDQQARLAITVSLANENHQHAACENLVLWLTNHEKYKSLGASLETFHEFDSVLHYDDVYLNAIDRKHYEYVREMFVKAAQMSPNNPDPEVQSSLGVLFNMKGEYEKAVDCFKAALSVKSDDSLLWNRLGATLANGNKSAEAVVAYKKALEISPGFLRSRYNLSISLIHLNTYDEAARQLVQILNMQAAGKGSKNTQIRTRSITSTAIWNTLRTVVTLMNKPDLYPIVDGRDLDGCNKKIFNSSSGPSSN